MKKNRVLLMVIIAVLIAAFFAFDLNRYFTLDFFKSQQAAIDGYVQASPLQAGLLFFLIYVAVTGLSLPGAAS